METTTTVVAGGAPDDSLTVRYVRAGGSNREIGKALATVARAVHGPAAGPLPGGGPAVQRARRTWFRANYPALAERVLGVADAFGVDPNRDDIALAWLATYGVPAGCSSVFYPGRGTKDGHGLLARNFDFPTLTYTQLFGLAPLAAERPLAADPWIVELQPDDGLASITIGIMDVMGAMDGVNEAGLAVSLMADNESPNQEPTGRPQVGLSEQQIVRYLLDTCTTVDEAEQALLAAKQYYAFVPCHYLVADRSGDAFVWEYSPAHNVEHVVRAAPETSGRMVCTNHLLHRWPDGAALPTDEGIDGTAALTYSRWRTLTAEVGDGAVVDRDDIRDQFRAVRFAAPVEQARTFWHAQYDVDAAAVELELYLHDHDGVSQYTEPIRFALS